MRKTTYPFLLAVIAAVFGALVSAGFVASAQNANSSTTMTNSNTNSARPRQPRRPRPRPSPSPEATADTTAMPEATPEAPRRTGRCDPNQQEQTDLSGTYVGKLKHGNEAPVDATLTVTGNNFTMTMGSDTHTGRITAVTTCGYTAVTVMHGDMSAPAPGATPPAPNKTMSLRAKKVGDSLTLMSVPGEPEQVMFTTGGGAGRPRRHRPRRPPSPPAAPSPTPPQQ